MNFRHIFTRLCGKFRHFSRPYRHFSMIFYPPPRVNSINSKMAFCFHTFLNLTVFSYVLECL